MQRRDHRLSSGEQAAEALLGRVVKPHGIQGELVVVPLSDVPGRLAPGTDVRIGELDTTVTGCRPHQGRLLVAVADVEDRTAAERLRGASVHGAALDEEAYPTYFAHELIGCELVRGDQEQPVGTVTDLYDLPPAAGYEMLEVTREDGATLLVPAVDELIEVREGEDGIYLAAVDPPEGLLD